MPDDLNTDVVLSDLETYLADRMDEEIARLLGIKKSISLQAYLQLTEDTPDVVETSVIDYLIDIENNDLLVNEVHSQEWETRAVFYGIQLD